MYEAFHSYIRPGLRCQRPGNARICDGCCAGPAAPVTPAVAPKAEPDEVAVKLEDCPKAVQDARKIEVGAGKIEKRVKEVKDGKTISSADAEIESVSAGPMSRSRRAWDQLLAACCFQVRLCRCRRRRSGGS